MKVPRREEESNGEINYKTQWTIIILVTTTITTLGLLQHSANIMILTDHHSIAISLPLPAIQSFWLFLAPNLLVNALQRERPPPPPSCYKLNNLMTRIHLYYNCKLYFPLDSRAINWLALWLQILFYFCCHFFSFQIVFLVQTENRPSKQSSILSWYI